MHTSNYYVSRAALCVETSSQLLKRGATGFWNKTLPGLLPSLLLGACSSYTTKIYLETRLTTTHSFCTECSAGTSLCIDIDKSYFFPSFPLPRLPSRLPSLCSQQGNEGINKLGCRRYNITVRSYFTLLYVVSAALKQGIVQVA